MATAVISKTLLLLAAFSFAVHAQNFTETANNPCDTNPCEEGKFCYLRPESVNGSNPYLCLADDYRPGTCSLNAYLSCDKFASCLDASDYLSFTCQCQESAVGDGFKADANGTGCQFSFKPCSSDIECPEFGYCDTQTYKCACRTGFQGDGFNCKDINECQSSPCHEHATCQNTPGNFTCTCDALHNYVGDGHTCVFFCYNDNDCDVPRAKCDARNKCQCILGYQGDGLVCTDVNECAEVGNNNCSSAAECINKLGGYQCQCGNGFSGDGYTCSNRPQRCDDIKNFQPGATYTIDPDFTGPAKAFDVICDIVSGVVVTKVPPIDTFPLAASEDDTPVVIHYKPTPSDVIPLIEGAVFCSQDISFSCYAKFALFPGTVWSDARGRSHENWGSTKNQKCACGEVGLCPNRCYCDGNQTQTLTTDSGQIVDKDSLPVVSLSFKQGKKDKGRINIGSLLCAQTQINLPKDCHEAKFKYNIKKNAPMYVDVDGLNGLKPALVYCDMQSYSHVGITSVPPGSAIVVPTSEVKVEVTYNTDLSFIQALINGSLFCSQFVEFQCKNSKLLANGGYVSVTGSSQRLDYFPGANGENGSCGCGATKSCEDPQARCNCDIQDGRERKDFGLIINKEHLPVVGLNAVVGDNRNGVFRLGNVQCSQKQFSIEPNCEKYRATGNRENYTYFIDPDGPGGVDPYAVECRYLQNPNQGQTIVHQTNENQQTLTDKTWDVYYLQASAIQIEALKNRSTVCTQEIHVGCRELRLHGPGGTITWTGAAKGKYSLTKYLDTCGDSGRDCNCGSGAGYSTDSGFITDLDKLPVNSLNLTSLMDQLTNGGQLRVTLGPLICSEVFPTCAILKSFLTSGRAVEGEAEVINGKFTIDPDGAGGVEGFEVTCNFPTTIISIEGPVGGLNPDPENPNPVSTCFNINYKNENGKTISPAQVTALVQKSGKCRQDLVLECQNAPATNKVNFTSCDGQPQKGWAGSFGEDKCACGVNGNCDGGPQAACNCDMGDDVVRSDGGSLINKTSMPVCQICLSIDPIIPVTGGTSPKSMLRYKLGELKCDTDQGTKTTCQDARQNAGTAIKTVQETAVTITADTGLPVGCRFFPDPPVGMLVVKTTNPVNPPSVGNQTDVKVVYITIRIHQVRLTFKDNEFCSQNIFLFNATAQNLELSGNWGFFTFDGRISEEWTVLNETSKYVQKACKDNADLCSRFGLPKGFSLTNKDDLPVTRVLLSGVGVIVVVGDVECLDLKKSCQHLLDTNSKTKGFIGGKRYAIDPDGSSEIDPFVVNCEFDQANKNGISEVLPSGQWIGEVTVVGKKLPASFNLTVEYNGVTAEQISALTEVSESCWQWVIFNCRYTPLVNRTSPALNSFYDLYGFPTSPSFGTGDDVKNSGCACAQTGTCMSSYSCNCDALGPLAVDQGAVTNKKFLPITRIFVGGQQNTRSVAKVQVTGVRCSSLPLDPPRDCADAHKIGSRFGVSYSYNGEYLISPSPGKVHPFMVRCEFDFSPGIGVTIIKVVSENVALSKPGIPSNISYHSPSQDQLQALIDQSKYCYQAVKYLCRSSTLFSEGGYWVSSKSATQQTFWGGGQPSNGRLSGLCACGQEQNCGGLDSANGQRTRPCNCDFGDNTTRADAGIISVKEYLPVTKFVIGRYAKFLEASLTVGDLYCSQEPLRFNECEMGFSDCHPRATCVDQDVGYRCVCSQGWNGKGVVINSNQARANGRECIDDDECAASKPCPYSATCVNTPGDFKCVCRQGYRQTGKTTCQDINECSNSTLNVCDTNARCENLDGSYRCICNRGYRGNGQTCIPVGNCVCFGDPHCISYDNRWLHIQDTCDYIMSQDGCEYGQLQTFRVEIQTWNKDSSRPGKFSYVKSVRVYIFDKVIILEQGGRIVIDGRVVRQYYDGHRFGVSVVNNRTQLWTVYDLQVNWDGQDIVQIIVPNNAKDSVCGLCGNYNGNVSDDTIQGPTCLGTWRKETTNSEQFVQSWITKNSSCKADCWPNQPSSSDNQCIYPKALVERECRMLLNTNNSPFKDCLKLKDSVELSEFLYSCVYDLCHVEESLEDQICRFGQIVAWDCNENEKINVSGWKSKVQACEAGPQCPNNLIYQACGKASQQTCLSFGQEQSAGPASCVEGCFCEAGLVLEGDRCISPQQCGCSYDNGYLAVGDTVLLPDCSVKVQCVSSNHTVEQPAGCHENEECQTEDGVLGCYCKEGYIKNNAENCAPDVCYKVECKKPNMVCVNGSCSCKEGYIGDCNHCVDVDECLTDIAECGRIGQTCLNTNGSFRCICEDGYVGNGQICKDIDECQYQIDNCGDNSKCVNVPGSFMCECCAGYTKSIFDTCVRDTAAGPVDARCCACQSKHCDDSGKVCGTDGKTYSSFRSLSIDACRNNNDQLKINYRGPCKDTCETTVCNKQYSTCVMKDGVPTCLCPTCSNTSSSHEDITVCGTDNITYISKCHLEAANCKAHFDIKVEVQYTGRPCPGNGPPQTGPWSNWSDCSEDCKQGVQTRTRDVYVNSSDVSIHSVETIPCYSTCDQGPCRQDTCRGPGQVCVADTKNNAQLCLCPMCEDFPEDFICGRLGLVIKTYINECELNRTACKNQEPDYEVLEPRSCEEKPISCGLVRKYSVVVDENGCEADRSINFGECYGGCDLQAELCCFGSNVAMKSAVMYCPDGTHFQRFFEVITECSCVSKNQANSRR